MQIETKIIKDAAGPREEKRTLGVYSVSVKGKKCPITIKNSEP